MIISYGIWAKMLGRVKKRIWMEWPSICFSKYFFYNNENIKSLSNKLAYFFQIPSFFQIMLLVEALKPLIPLNLCLKLIGIVLLSTARATKYLIFIYLKEKMPLFKMKTKELARCDNFLQILLFFLKHISEFQTTMSNEQYCYNLCHINYASLKKMDHCRAWQQFLCCWMTLK